MPAQRLPLVALVALLAFVVAMVAVVVIGEPPSPVSSKAEVRVRIFGSEPATWDPAAAGDAASAAVIAQVHEGLTAFDDDNTIQPALADRWQVSDDGRTIIFHLRPGIAFSDGSPITGEDVVESWLRLLDPRQPSPIFSLLADIDGAVAYVSGQAGRDAVGLRAEGESVVVTMRRPASYFLAVTGAPMLAIVPPAVRRAGALAGPPTVVSGAYVPSIGGEGVIHFAANVHYWAGPPALAAIEQVSDIGGRSPVDAFEANDIDYTPISSFDASWIRYSAALGPQLRAVETLSLTYYGFDTTQAPFDDVLVRRAFAQAVNWDRIVSLGSGRSAATSMLPPGIPGRDENDYRPPYDPDAARALLAQAGYPGGSGFPPVVVSTYGGAYEATVAAELREELGIEVSVEVREFQDYFERLGSPGGPAIWTLSWIADYPQAYDFLGLLLETGSSSNPGHFSDADYDRTIAAAAAAPDQAEQARFFGAAQEILRDQVPVVPLDYGENWALSRSGLLGAQPSGLGLLRFAGLDWATGSGR